MRARRPEPLLAGVAILAWGLAPWVADLGLLALVGMVAWAALARRTGWAAVVGAGAASLQLLWVPTAWTDAQGGGLAEAWAVWAVLAGLQGLPCALATVLARGSRRLGWGLACGAAWATAEGLSGWLQVLPANSGLLLADGPLWLFPASLGGTALLSGLAGAFGGLAGVRPVGAGALALLWAATALLPGPGRVGDPVRVAVVQPDVHIVDARVPSHADRLADRLVGLVASVQADLVATPEGSWPHDPGEGPGTRRDAFRRAVAGLPPVLLGATVGSEAPRWNSVLAVEHGQVARVDKRVLVPAWERSWLGVGHDRYSPGEGPPILELAGLRVGVLVCYEDLFVGAVRAADADVLLAATNDGWLARSGREAHLAAARLAAVSTGRYVIRPTLDGVSAILDPAGRALVEVPSATVWWPDAPGRVAVAEIWRTAGRPGARLAPWLAGLCGFVSLASRRRP
ncbi:MAG: hypothetical protein H6736_08030 [Alphaproteobacteria bacterium]|nr:hypothetical protein [Alphaproteobacteria bacterium]MCB9691747.1 hypothetical protein [Alphaproteobacteria bacterium]